MAVDKLVDSTQLDTDLTSVANAIRTKGGTSAQLAFPSDFVTAIANIPTGITPTGTKQISITQSGTTTEDVTNYASAQIAVNVPSSVTALTFAAIRPDAEAWKQFNRDSLLIDDDGITFPSYSTTAKTLEAARNEATVTLDQTTYDYFVSYSSLIYPIYNSSTISTGQLDYSAVTSYFELTPRPTISSLNGNKTVPYPHTSSYRGVTVKGLVYWATSSKLMSAEDPSAGIYEAAPTLTISSGVLTFKHGAINIKGSASQLSSTAWGRITDVRVQQKVTVWRVAKNSANLDGWSTQQLIGSIVDAVASPTHTLS